jgi:crotonobetaine/carnitine-CoA ligase
MFPVLLLMARRRMVSEDDLMIDVVLMPGEHLAKQDLARFINETAPCFFVSRFIEPKTYLPYTPTQKVQKYLLRERGVTPNTWDTGKADFEVIRQW